MMKRPLVIPDLMLRIHAPNRSEIADQISITPHPAGRVPSEIRFIFVCFTNRSGSAYLGDILSSTGIFGPPRETLNAGAVLAYCRDHGIRSFADYFGRIVQRDATNKIFIVKVAPEQIVLLIQAGILDEIIERSAFLFLNRADKLSQAISRAIAEQNNRWAWDSPSELPDDKLVYSSDRITQHVYDIAVLNLCFEQFFGLNGIVPINVEYERLLAEPQQELDMIARRLGLPGLTANLTRLRYRRQANEINQSWRSRFIQGEPPPGTVPVAATVQADIIAHVRNIGDVAVECGIWVGTQTDGSWIEGFTITPRQGMSPGDIEYRVVQEYGRVSPWASGGTFCGTRGMSLPLRGLCVRLSNAAAQAYECVYSGRFLDGATIGPVPAAQLCHSESLAPLVAFQIVIRPR